MSPVLALAVVVAVALAFALGIARGRGDAARKRRASMGLPPAPAGPGILAVVPALPTSCPSCGKAFNRHPAVVEKRCSACVAEAFEAEDEAFVEGLKAQGWGK